MRSLSLGSGNAPSSVFTGSITGNTLSVTALASGPIAAGQYVSGTAGGTGVLVGTQIIAQLSGSAGGTGTYSVNQPQGVGSQILHGTTPTATLVTVQANQVPQITAPNIAVTAT